MPVLAYYLLTDYTTFLGFLRQLVRPERRAHFDGLVQDLDRALRGYLVGQATLSVVAGAAATLILTLSSVQPALVVGLAAAVLELIPVVGPATWVLVAVVLTAVQQPTHTVPVAILAVLAHQIDMHLLAPRILGRHLRLHPVVVIVAVLAGNTLMGILGVLLAAPLAATLTITLRCLVTEGVLSPAAIVQGDCCRPAPGTPDPSLRGQGAAPRTHAGTRNTGLAVPR